MRWLPGVTILLLGISLCIFSWWALSVAVPVTIVEAQYQYKRILRDTFHVADIRAIILPQLRVKLDDYEHKHTTNGLAIPSIFLDEPITYNVDPSDESAYKEALRHGIAHASGTAFPGQAGLGYYFAHSSSPEFVRQYNAVFYLLGKLKIGDEVSLWHEGERSEYVVTKTQVTSPRDVSFLSTPYSLQTIVLQTCWPPGTTKERLLVFAEKK